MAQRSLEQLLTRQWMLFACATAGLFVALGLLLLFLLEDSFIDRRLRAAASAVNDPAAVAHVLSPEFSVFTMDKVPLDVHAKLSFATAGKPFEMRRANRHYAHVLLDVTARGDPFVVVYDVTDELTVTPSLGAGFWIVTFLTAVILAMAFGLARAFVGRVTSEAATLAQEIREGSGPSQLRQLANQQKVREFSYLLSLYADVWETQLRAVDRERQTLAYLGHELRTPLQTLETSLALLSDSPSDEGAWARMRRAVSRLSRASTAVLWLESARPATSESHTDSQRLINELVAEFAPLAKARNQIFDVSVLEPPDWHGPKEVAETVLANVLLNAVQHGASGTISVIADANTLRIANPREADGDISSGFGLGLEIVRRLGSRIGWRISYAHEATFTQVEIEFGKSEIQSVGPDFNDHRSDTKCDT